MKIRGADGGERECVRERENGKITYVPVKNVNPFAECIYLNENGSIHAKQRAHRTQINTFPWTKHVTWIRYRHDGNWNVHVSRLSWGKMPFESEMIWKYTWSDWRSNYFDSNGSERTTHPAERSFFTVIAGNKISIRRIVESSFWCRTSNRRLVTSQYRFISRQPWKRLELSCSCLRIKRNAFARRV